MKSKVLHLSTLHRGDDSRMILKMAFTTALRYRTLALVTQQCLPNADLEYHFLPYHSSLIKRLGLVHPLALWKSLRLRPDIVHVHAPEALPIALVHHWLGATVIFDVYENMGKQLKGKQVNNNLLFRSFFKLFDHIARKKFHFIFAEDSYRESYSDLAKSSVVIHNFPDLTSIPVGQAHPKEPAFFYLGQLSKARCLDVMIEAAGLLRKDYPTFRWHIFGKVGFDLSSMEEVEQMPGYAQVKENLIFYGYTPAREAYQKGAKCLAGIALLKPIGDFEGSYPTKIFEYMALGLPVITSNFPLYQSVVEHHSCGHCVNPTDAGALYESLKFFIENPNERTQMGERGKTAVQKHYNWAGEQQKLLAFYEKVIKEG
ncbi:glycosyltransferase [Siphonobacter sp. SORGH_AS_0500]|uniref:glycosyltransferase n=1 Tax=Siphonobacter sp. SORGH_AS_0500 TaxID=1864824 RepID=UPI000CA93C85|nr:glycosyltransferase [Siphonobacter sp. SORGH_AS_0500]MDR6196213.1 glycosyltransferase involved in cell wall biosynthesis [Siphonobacter sp. SORGH_AS_0500]PKK38168.1 hypothetical protein BWI96_03590 [Siphonobacter sp. SORGH_AS_0500]